MKGAMLFIAIFALSMLIIPMIALSYQPQPPSPLPLEAPALREPEPGAVLNAEPVPPVGPPDLPLDIGAAVGGEHPRSTISGVSYFHVLDESTGEIHVVSLRDYVRGAVAAEMPASFHPEALKAQAVAAHTFALHQHMAQRRSPDPALRGADFSADPSNRRGYVTEQVAREIFGINEDENWEKITNAADSVLHLILKYDYEPIVAAYHAMSAGGTEYAGNVWTGSAPYLIPAPSAGDLQAPGFETRESFSADSLRETFWEAYPDIEFEWEPSGWMEVLERSSSGYVTTIRVGDTRLRGIDVRRALYLRSHHFEIEQNNGAFTFTVRGYGHGVGLSQRGADYMARQGAGFEEILANYYTGARLYRIDFPH